MGWLQSLFQADDVIGIAGDTLKFAQESARDAHPNEYMGMLRATPAADLNLNQTGSVITDIMVIPGTESGPVSASVKSWMVPNDSTSVGSIHSHPSGSLRPSDEDLATFGKGQVHIILGAPYDWNTWEAYDNSGNPFNLPVLSVDLPDPASFFDFTQQDIDDELREEHQ